MLHIHSQFRSLKISLLTLVVTVFQSNLLPLPTVNAQLPTLRFAAPRKMAASYYVQSMTVSPDGKQLAYFGSELGQRAPGNLSYMTALSVINTKTGAVLYKDRPTPPNNQQARSTTGSGFRFRGEFSPDGKRLAWAAGYRKHKFYLRNERGVVKGLDDAGGVLRLGTSAAFSPDGKILATGQYSPARIFLWNAQTGQKIREFTPAVSQVSALRFSPDGKYLACSDRRSYFLLLDAKTGNTYHKITNTSSSYPGMCFSPDGKMLAVTGSSGTALWDVANKRFIKRLSGVSYNVAYSPDGRFLAIGNQSGVQLWDASGQYRLATLSIGAPCWTLAFSPNGQQLYVSRSINSTNHSIWAWNLRPTGVDNGPRTAPNQNDLALLWNGLRADSMAKAYPSLLKLAASPRESVAFLKTRLKPQPVLSKITRLRILRLIATLNSPQFQAREEASQELEDLGRAVVPFLRKVRKASPSPRMNKQLDQLVQKLDSRLPDEDQAVRAVQVLELANGADSRAILERLSQGEPTAPLTLEAMAALKRMGS